MKSVLLSLDDAEFGKLERLAAAQSTTVDGLLNQCVQDLVVGPSQPETESRSRARQGLVSYIRSMTAGVTVGERPTRERTYSDSRFHRH
jgi:hypothetical protein